MLDSRRRPRMASFGVSLTALVGAMPGVASAQGAPASAGVESRTSDSEIVVTANKREQSIQDVAGGITALGGEQLANEGLTTVSEIASRVPSVEFGTTTGASFITIRGVGVGVDTGVAEPNTAIYVDGVYLPRATMQSLHPIDLERVEVLRGPQGTLYGRNATAGAVNYISRAPEAEPSGEVRALYGNYETVNLSARVTGGLGQNVRASLSGGYYNRGKGYYRNLFNGETYDKSEHVGVRGAISVDLASNLTFDASASYEWEQFDTINSPVRELGPATPILLPDPDLVAPFAPWTIGSEFVPRSDRSTFIARGQFNWNLNDDINLKSITGYIKHSFHNSFDGDGTSFPQTGAVGRTQPSESISQEFNVGGTIGDRGSWIVGLYGFHEKARSLYPFAFFSAVPLFGVPAGAVQLYDLSEKTNSVALFADATVPLSERFRVYGGIRLSRDEKTSIQNVGVELPGDPPILIPSCSDLKFEQIFKSANPRVGVQFDVAPDVMTFAQYSKGFKSGGVNSAVCNGLYEPEKLDAVEGGFKSRLFDRRLTLNASGFYYSYKGYQQLQIIGLTAAIANADTRVYGAEAEAQIDVNDYLQIDMAGTWLDAKFTNFSSLDFGNPAAGVQNLAGKRTPRSPKLAGSIGVQVNIPVDIASFSKLSIRGDARFSGSFYHQPFNVPEYQQKSSSVFNVNVVLADESNGLRIRAYGRNLTNEPILQFEGYAVVSDTYYGNWAPPRTYGLEIVKTF